MRYNHRLRRAAIVVSTPSIAILFATGIGFAPSPKEVALVTSCEIKFYYTHDVNLVLNIKDKKTIDRLVRDPLSKAKKNPHPARYVVLGNFVLHKSDGSEESGALFRPLGQIKIKEDYFVCEFTELRKYFKEVLGSASESLD